MDDIKKLAAKLSDKDIDWIVSELKYTTNRRVTAILVPYLQVSTVVDILNKRAGYGDWQFKLASIAIKGVEGFKAGIAIWDSAKGDWSWRAGVASANDKLDEPDAFDILKACESAALKRAAQRWGVGSQLSGISISIEPDQIHSMKDKKPPVGKSIIRLIDSKILPPIDAWCFAPLQKDWPKGA